MQRALDGFERAPTLVLIRWDSRYSNHHHFRSCSPRRNPRLTVIRVPPRQRTPIERHNLQTLNRANPSIKYKDVRKQSSVSSTELSLAEICAVCLETLGDEEDVRWLTCEHVFHTRCLDSWFKEHHVDCPLCKCIFIPN
ncbi:hypothetical protein H9Q72_012128 [Fusarium xylarioides]|uniref:Uncharacterized protein n=1 Tax=Fusarium xylarioides TaxID=221167 RepID=A0A9P7IAS3_9HYPO|nr:hypothetical protein H9Q72_012128 [Fusarium xylarioides]KAG5801067.1 hypothetical protein H9Q71_014351 [Fusarium xylarioides]KAG5824810.1 hypothetical protein H9Q74_005084 [Fusarium xylarioides]